MKSLRVLALCLALAAPVSVEGGAVIREPGAIYLEDLVPRKIKLQTLVDTPIFYQTDMKRYLGVIKKGQTVELQAVGDGRYRVRGNARQGGVAGWVDPKHLTALKREFVENLKQNAARLEEVQALIARNEVAINMTVEEVAASLGKPEKKTSRMDAAGREDVWEFVRYERVPQEVTGYDRFGRLVSSIVYVKVPAGTLSVTFADGLVSALEQSEGTLASARPKIVPAPFNVIF
ncbi:MAG: hypothetical protein ACO1QR_09580 [Chthoniobacteraceae bacterium]